MEEIEREYIEKEQVVIKFECKGLKAFSTQDINNYDENTTKDNKRTYCKYLQ